MAESHQKQDPNVARALALDTATLSDALDRLGIAGQCLNTKPLDYLGYHQLQTRRQ